MVVDRNIKLINLYTICTNTVFILPVVVPYYKTIGLTFQDFLIAEAVFSAVILFAEIPSGWISDVWKRRVTLVCGLFFAVVGYFWLVISDSLIDVMIAQGTIGLAVAMNSGTVSAMLYDTLLMAGREDEYRRLEGKRHAMSLYSVACGSIVGALAFTIDPQFPLVLDLIILTIGMVAMSMAMEPVRNMKAPEKHILRDIYETILYTLHGHKEISGIILVSMVLFCASKLMMWSQQPYYQMVGIPIEWFGVVMAGCHALGGVAGHCSHMIEKFGSNRMKLGCMVGATSIACLVLSLYPSLWFCVPLFLTGTLVYGMGFPMVQSAINSRVGSERRATILSTASLMVHVLTIPTSLLMGYMANQGGVQSSLSYLGWQILILGGIGLWLWKAKDPAQS